MDAFGCMVQGSFLTYMYSVGRHSRRSSSSINRTGKSYAAHLARLDYLLIYLPTQVQLTLTKIIKIVATKWRILRLKCTEFDFGWGSAPDPAGWAYSAPPDPLTGFGGHTSKEMGREGRGREERGREGKGHEPPPLFGGSLRLWVRPLPDICRHATFHPNHLPPPLSEVTRALTECIVAVWWLNYMSLTC